MITMWRAALMMIILSVAEIQVTEGSGQCTIPSEIESCICFSNSTGKQGHMDLVPVGSNCNCTCQNGSTLYLHCFYQDIWLGGDCKDAAVTLSRKRRFLEWLIPAVVVIIAIPLIVQGISCGHLRFWDQCRNHAPGPILVRDKEKPRFISCPSEKIKPNTVFTAKIKERTVRVDWPEPDVTDNIKVQEIYHDPDIYNSGQDFVEGDYVITFTAVDSSWNKNTDCQLKFSVQVRKCKEAKKPENGYVKCDNTPTIYGEKCTFSCDNGYTLNGSVVQICEKNGQYTGGGSVNCKVVECPAPVLPDNNTIAKRCDPKIYNHYCEFKCREGFSTNDPGNILCLASGNWSGIPPLCKDTSPPEIQNCHSPLEYVDYTEKRQTAKKITLPEITATDNVDVNITAKLISGPPSGSVLEVGEYEYEFKAQDKAGNPSVPCRFKLTIRQLRCGYLRYERIMNITYEEGRAYGSLSHFTCEPGYTLRGSSSATCEKTADVVPVMFWNYGNGTEPKCEEKLCDPLTPPANGALVCDTWSAGKGTHCSMQCNEAWDIPITARPIDVFVCSTMDGVWKPYKKVPNCTVKRKANEMRLHSKLYYFTSDCTSASAQTKIKENFLKILNGSAYQSVCNIKKCNVDNVKVFCGPRSTGSQGRRRRDTFTHSLLIEFAFVLEIDYSGNFDATSKYEAMNRLFVKMAEIVKTEINNGTFDLEIEDLDIETRTDTFIYQQDLEMACGYGMQPRYSTFTCAACPTGTHFDRGSSPKNPCVPCKIGTYQDKDAQLTCYDCPSNTSTSESGTSSLAGCISYCPRGSFSKNGLVDCTKCSVGSYQPSTRSTSCIKCPYGLTTISEGSTASTDCLSFDIQFISETDLTPLRHSFHTSQTSSDITISGWFLLNNGNNETLMTLSSDKDQLSLTYSGSLRMEISGYHLDTNLTLALHKFVPIVLTWKSSVSSLSVHTTNKQYEYRTQAENIFLTSKNMQLSIGFRGVVTNVNVFEDATPDLTKMITSCAYSHQDALSGWKDVVKGKSENSKVVIPSNCDVTDNCDPNPCDGHECTDRLHGFRCDCSSGYSGVTCEIAPNYCKKHACQNEADCVSADGGYTCKCKDGYFGELCENEIVHGNWADWNAWSKCSVTCGGGIHTRSRECSNPPPGTHGKPCEGDSIEKAPCNTDSCPECTPIKRSFGTVIACDKDTDLIQCTVKCRDNKVFTKPPHTIYQCGRITGYIWSHQLEDREARLPDCTDVNFPRTIFIDNSINFDMECDKSNAIKNQMKQNIDSVGINSMCKNEEACNSSVESKCDSGSRRRRQTSQTISLVMQVNLTDEKLYQNLTGLSTNETAYALANIYIRALQNLDKVMTVFRESVTSGKLDVIVDGQTIKAKGLQQRGYTPCQPGMVADPNTFLCVKCAPGSYEDGTCLPCAIGSYQPMDGQTSCVACPVNFTTANRGTRDPANCDVPWNGIAWTTRKTTGPDNTKTTTMPNRGGDTSGNDDFVIPLSVTSTLLVVLIGAIVFVVIKKKHSGRVSNPRSADEVTIKMSRVNNVYIQPAPPSYDEYNAHPPLYENFSEKPY